MEVSGHDGAGNFALEAGIEASAARVSSNLARVPEVRCKVGRYLLGTQRVTTNFSLLSVKGHHLFRADESSGCLTTTARAFMCRQRTETEVSVHAG
jgi:hypothetical protein